MGDIRKKYKLFQLVVLGLLGVITQQVLGDSIVGSKHDLSPSGWYGTGAGSAKGGVDPLATNEICVFCHTPHNANNDLDDDGILDSTRPGGRSNAPLWNRRLDPTVGFTPYQSDTLNAACASIPSPVTLACLSCHDDIDHNSGRDGAVTGQDVHNLVNPSNAS